MITTLEPIIRAEDLFEKLNQERESREERRIEIKGSLLDGIFQGYEQMKKYVEKFPNLIMDGNEITKTLWDDFPVSYTRDLNAIACAISPCQNIPARDITSFSMMLKQYTDKLDSRLLGFYISGLINKSEDNELILNFLGSLPIDYLLLYSKRKKVKIKGDIGSLCCCEIKDCHINIEGNVGEGIGMGMKRSVINVIGNVGAIKSLNALNSKINIYGNHAEIDNRNSHDFYVYNNGNLVMGRKK